MADASYLEVVEAVRNYYQNDPDKWVAFAGYGGKTLAQRVEIAKSVPGVTCTVSRHGNVIGWDIANDFPREFNPPAVIDSNIPNSSYGNGGGFATKINGNFEVIDDTTTPPKTSWTSGARKVSTGTKVFTTAGNVLNTVGAAMLGAKLGKAINSAFGGQYAWKESDWEDWVSGLDPLDQAVFRTLFDIDGDTTTAYLPEDMLGSMYLMLNDMGAFTTPSSDIIDWGEVDTAKLELGQSVYTLPIHYMNDHFITRYVDGNYWDESTFTVTEGSAKIIPVSPNVPYVYLEAVSTEPFTIVRNTINSSGATQTQTYTATNTTTRGGITYYYIQNLINFRKIYYEGVEINTINSSGGRLSIWDLGYILYNGDSIDHGGVEGITDDPRADQIDPSKITGTTPETVLLQLKQNYPQLFDGSIYEDVPQEDGTTKRITYIPVPWPTKDNKGDPITGTPSQTNPKVDPNTATDTETKTITDTILGSPTGSPTDTTTVTPPATGDGDSPATVLPSGSASSLWAVYNPTQAQVDAFGAWLWSSDLVDQIKKLFNDPMQAIIGIHKVFATPATGAAQNIKCGYIDSGVPAAVVTSQYTTVDCGTVNCREYFGNVFDYAPYTEVSLYLPFIGIVKLDCADVMRSSISVKYHVDVITGACLADVVVRRDSSGGVLYQYSGSAIVTYPISSGSYASALAGVVSIAGGVIGTIASGGALAPAALGAAVGVSHLHSDVQKSGSFSGAAGAMGGKIPYLIISRPQSAMPSSYKHLEGQPANHYTKLGDASGHVKVRAVQVKGVDATDTELDMIEQLLKQGVEL